MESRLPGPDTLLWSDRRYRVFLQRIAEPAEVSRTSQSPSSGPARQQLQAQIGATAWREHLPVYELTPERASLEEAFMQVTQDSVEYHAGATR